jgi:hypothetical protein
MLYSTRKKLKVLLKKILIGIRYIKVSGDSVVLKPHFLSFTRYVYPIKTLLEYTIPECIISDVLSKEYTEMVLLQVKDGNTSLAVDNAFTVLAGSNHLKKCELKQKTIKINGTKILFQRLCKKAKSTLILLKKREKDVLVIRRYEEKAKNIIGNPNIFGAVTTGNKKFDDQFRQIQRYAHAKAG